MSVDYKQLKELVIQELVDGPGGSIAPSAPDVPHRMPAADGWDKEQDEGDEKANKLYETALVAREATEILVEALDEPIFDAPYEHAFKASACLRRVLNSLEDIGAHPMPTQRVVAAPSIKQKYNSMAGLGDSRLAPDAPAPASGGGLEEVRMDVGALQGKMKQAVTLYNSLPEKEKKAFQAFILGHSMEPGE